MRSRDRRHLLHHAVRAAAIEALEGRLLFATAQTLGTDLVSTTSAHVAGVVNAQGGSTLNFFQYSTSPNFLPQELGRSTFLDVERPTDVAVDADQNVWVVHTLNAIDKYGPGGNLLAHYDFAAIHEAVLEIAIGGGNMYAVDLGDVRKFNPSTQSWDLAYEGSLGSLTVGHSGSVFTVDDDLIMAFPPDLDPSKVTYLYDGQNGNVGKPTNLAVDAAGNLYFRDALDNTVKKLNPSNGSTQTIFTNVPANVDDMQFDPFGDLYTITRGDISRFRPDGTFEHVSSGTSAIGIDFAGTLYTPGADFADRVDRIAVPLVLATPLTVTGSQDTPIGANLTGLTQATTYYFRAEASASGTTVFGDTKSFKTLPVSAVTSVRATSPDGTYKEGDQVTIQVQFNNPVTVTGSPQVTLNSGGVAIYQSGSGTSVLSFKYTVRAGQNASDLDYTSTGALTPFVNGSINVGDDPATLTLPAPGAAGSLGAANDIVIDTTAPNFVSFTPSVTVDPDRAAITYAVKFDEPVTGATVDAFDWFGTAAGTVVQSVTGNGTDTLTVTVQPGSYGTVGLFIPDTTVITDLVGHPLTGDQIFDDKTVSVPEPSGLVVNTDAGTLNPYDGATSLADAVAYANSLPNGTYDITFAPEFFNFGPPATITLAATLMLNHAGSTIDITGPDAGVTISGDDKVGVCQVKFGTTANLSRLTVANGKAKSGAGIDNAGTLNVNQCTFTGNTGVGAVNAISLGGAIATAGLLSATNSTFANNSADYGGAIVVYSGFQANLHYCTISGNHANRSGGGILSQGSLGLFRTLVSGNTGDASTGGANELDGKITTGSALNVFGHAGETTGQAITESNVGATGAVQFLATSDGPSPQALSSILNPTLSNNGGPTQTFALVAGSIAIDQRYAGDGQTVDQRGFPPTSARSSTRPINSSSRPRPTRTTARPTRSTAPAPACARRSTTPTRSAPARTRSRSTRRSSPRRRRSR